LTISVHAVDGGAASDARSPLVYDPRAGSAYVGRGAHWRIYNFMQRTGALTPAVASHAHGYRRPDGTFEWDEHFPVPGAAEVRALAAALDGREEAVPRNLRRHLRPLRSQAGAVGRELVRTVRPARPRDGTPRRVRPYPDFLSPGGFASRCRWVLTDDGLSVDETIENDWWFCKSDWIEHFFREHAPDTPFVLFTGDSDRAIGRRFGRFLRRRSLVAWFATNAAFAHPKLIPLPLGLGDPGAAHGDAGEAVRSARDANLPRTRLVEVSFDVKTNPRERIRCLAKTGLELDPPVPTSEYLERLASSSFCLAPPGNGIDTHRTWEALYLRTIPVVRRSLLTDRHPELPFLVLDDWSELELSEELYARTWGDWDPAELSLDRYLQRVRRTVDELRRRAASP
jgi:hypothetical protein